MKNEPIIKTFIGAVAPNEIFSLINKIKNNINFSKGKIIWENYNNLHLTFKYLGPTLLSEIENISNILYEISKQSNKINLSVTTTGVFPNINRPRVYFLGINGEIDLLNTFIDQLSKSMMKIGYPNEKTFYKPHITIAKSIYPQNKTPNPKNFIDFGFNEIPFVVEKIILYQSIINKNQITYKMLKDFSFKSSRRVWLIFL